MSSSSDNPENRDAGESPVTLMDLRFEAARRLGCEVIALDPETGFLNEIRKGSVRRVLVGGLSPLNDAVAARIVGDKSHTLRVLASRGFRVPQTARCLKPEHFRNDDYLSMTGTDPALAFAAENGYPVVVKPNFGSRGLDITCAEDSEQLVAAIEQVWRRDYLALAQEVAGGFDLRIDFLDGEYLFGYTRTPVAVVGDGESPLRELLRRSDPRFSGSGFEAHLENDPIWRQRVEAAGLGLDAVPERGRGIDFDTPILNLNRLCHGRRVEVLPGPWKDFGLKIGRVFSLRHFGIDLKIESMDQDPQEATVIEVNSSPSLAHMARMGHLEAALDAERRIVEAILRSTPPSE